MLRKVLVKIGEIVKVNRYICIFICTHTHTHINYCRFIVPQLILSTIGYHWFAMPISTQNNIHLI